MGIWDTISEAWNNSPAKRDVDKGLAAVVAAAKSADEWRRDTIESNKDKQKKGTMWYDKLMAYTKPEQGPESMEAYRGREAAKYIDDKALQDQSLMMLPVGKGALAKEVVELPVGLAGKVAAKTVDTGNVMKVANAMPTVQKRVYDKFENDIYKEANRIANEDLFKAAKNSRAVTPKMSSEEAIQEGIRQAKLKRQAEMRDSLAEKLYQDMLIEKKAKQHLGRRMMDDNFHGLYK